MKVKKHLDEKVIKDMRLWKVWDWNEIRRGIVEGGREGGWRVEGRKREREGRKEEEEKMIDSESLDGGMTTQDGIYIVII